ncbi:MAG: alanine racemase [Planctomycetes bacterium GWF2_41_51]|nr:MAG: alanine racemase [Planctomycetes bacterium GWF2_41_51]HBG27811.1 alanine racemase [Phycisphaerales bacterium]
MSRWPEHIIAQINLSAIRYNCREIRKRIPSGCKICVAVKCNAYGHGMDVVMPAFKDFGIDMVAVATISEAMHLKQIGWKKAILLLGSEFSMYHGKLKTEIAQWLIENDIRIMLMTANDMKSLVGVAKSLQKQAKVHLKFDSGMSRMGLDKSKLLTIAIKANKQPNICIEGLCTHLATADESDNIYCKHQIKQFKNLYEELNCHNIKISLIHIANSAAIMNGVNCHYNLVRPGLAIYGYNPNKEQTLSILKPCMRIISFLTVVKKIKKGDYIGYGCTRQANKEMIIGIVPIGYGDGYDRRLSNQGIMTIDGINAPVLGLISMDQTIIDLSNVENHKGAVCPGRKVVIIDNDPSAPNSVESIARQMNTIAYEVVTRLGNRIIRTAV